MTISNSPDKFLGIQIKRQHGILFLNQESYVKKILEKFRMEDAKPVTTPMEVVTDDESNDQIKIKYPYLELIGNLMYLTNKTRPDISYAVNFCSRRMEEPKTRDVKNLKRILIYLVSSKEDGICFRKTSECEKLIAYCDADFAGDV
ncbi:uncharacterized mitochondrial protein AtMg00810-like [Harmonia axyridis]|uniref:uncharacterized mitochondrial protein AtMg00810-like n=1 Tax=Harmonia axyridis TaxID=115357 RepID=UPI001E2774A2|nr:uncharacterized mitochondrial protein AtMg00810-like [Harmonia axyridis]